MENKYGKIPASNAVFPAEEPLFLIRAQDKFAARTVRHYADLREKAGDAKGAKQCREVAKAMDAWPKKKRPD